MERLVKHAYQHWNEVSELDEEFPIGNASHSLTMQNGHIEVLQGPQDPNFQRTVLLQEQGNSLRLICCVSCCLICLKYIYFPYKIIITIIFLQMGMEHSWITSHR